jgi:UDP-N-acetylmuramyl pentapeptide synthase
VCIGAGAQPIADGALGAGMNGKQVHQVVDVQAAYQLLVATVRAGDRVLCKASRRIALDRLVDQLHAHLLAASSPDRAMEQN